MMKTLYHCTKMKNLGNILKKGIAPNQPIRISEIISEEKPYPTGVYLSRKPFMWMDWATTDGKERGVLIKINAEGLTLLPDNNPKYNPKHIDSDDYICPDTIPPSRILEISIQEKGKINSFSTLEKSEWKKMKNG